MRRERRAVKKKKNNVKCFMHVLLCRLCRLTLQQLSLSCVQLPSLLRRLRRLLGLEARGGGL